MAKIRKNKNDQNELFTWKFKSRAKFKIVSQEIQKVINGNQRNENK